ncbi:MAG: hypothetical protein EA364_12420 [Balneolaceae bacterium]|jgi:hypothetical protein|nr:MAG: hypothetical protein EA364_12420 [Balneolaceae bacterium]
MNQQQNPKESDWKQFRKMVPGLRERYLEETIPYIQDVLNDKNRTPTQRFWDTYKKMEKTGRILEDCLDGHSRSKMEMYMSLMFRYGLLKDEDLKHFSEELQDNLQRIRGFWER